MVSPVAPRQGRSPGGSPLGGFGTEVPLPCPGDPGNRSSRCRVRQDPRPKPWFRLAGHAPKRWVLPGSQLPGRNPVLPDPSEAEASSEPVAARLPEGTAFCRAGPRSEDPVSGLAGPSPPEEGSVPVGRCSKPAAFASAEGQARPRPHRGGFVSRPAVRFRRPHVRRRGQASAWAVAGKAHLRCRRIVSATPGSCHAFSSRPSGFRLWITRIMGISRRVGNRRTRRLPRARRLHKGGANPGGSLV